MASSVLEQARDAARLFSEGTDTDPTRIVALTTLLGLPRELAPPVAVQPGDAASALAAIEAIAEQAEAGHNAQLVSLVELEQIQERTKHMTDFLRRELATTEPISGSRLGTVMVALSQIGRVRANKRGALADDGKATREGWQHLDGYFRTAFGESYGPALKKTVRCHDLKLVAWCGIFCVWAMKAAGVQCKDWKLGSGIASVLQPTRTPRAGDVAFLDGKGLHMCLVLRITEDKLFSIDGNTNAAGAATGGQVAVQERRRKRVLGFYSQDAPLT